MIAHMEPILTNLLTSRGVKCVVVSSGGEEAVHSNGQVGEALIAAAKQVTSARGSGDTAPKAAETMLGHVFFRRHFGDATVCLVGDTTVSEAEIERRLNVASIRLQAVALGQTTSPLVSALRDAFVACTMPLSGRVFDRHIDELRRAHRSLDVPTMRALVHSLAAGLTAPSNENLLEQAEALFRAAGEGNLRTASSAPASTPSSNAPSANASSSNASPSGAPATARDSSAPRRSAPPSLTAVTAAKPRTVSAAGLNQVAIEVIGPVGPVVVRHALGRSPQEPVALDEAILRIGSQLAEPLRERFSERLRAAVDAG